MTLNDELCTTWRSGGSFDALMKRLVDETASRAAGCWRIENGHLVLVGFGTVSDMSDEISEGFQAATRRVRLDQLGLGIVRATVTRKPTIARRDPKLTGLDGSASWIVRFDCQSSLAIPIVDPQNESVVGALAVSTTDSLEENDAVWRTMCDLANQLGLANTESRSNP